MTTHELKTFIARELAMPQPDAVSLAARHVAARFGASVLGVLYYGSCLRSGRIDGNLLDFYVIVDRYRRAHGRLLPAAANKLLPPSVYYGETDVDGATIRAKYAVLSIGDLEYRSSRRCLNVSVWARFAQPAALVHVSGETARRRIEAAVAAAAQTMVLKCLPLLPDGADSRAIWSEALARTFSAEIRSERRGKGTEIYLADKARYDAVTPLILDSLGIPFEMPVDGGLGLLQRADARHRARCRAAWLVRKVNGKFENVLRLIKAAFTFDGGVDYLAWKIAKHSKVEVEIKPWHRRHPLLAGLVLFFSLRRKGAFR